MDQKRLKGAVIGYGGAFSMGRQHGDHMSGVGIDFAAACDTDPARIKAAEEENPGIKTYLDYRDLIQDPEIDLVVVVLPHNLHAAVAIDCLKAGKHVIVEKPMCITKAEAEAMIAAAKAAGKMLSVYQNRRWDGDYLAIKDIIDRRLIGDLVSLEIYNGHFSKPGDWWRSRKDVAGSVLHDWGAHFIDWTLNIVQSPVTGVYGHIYNGAWEDSTIEDHGQAIIKFSNGARAEITVSALGSIEKPKWRIIGTKGGIICDWGKPVTVRADHQGYLASFDVHPPQDDWRGYYRSIAEHLYEGKPLFVKPEESALVIAIIEAAERSSATGKVELP
jgi:scyllo-inositol 2-dehydrogenase (NADP+)